MTFWKTQLLRRESFIRKTGEHEDQQLLASDLLLFLSLTPFYHLNYCFPMPIWIYPVGVNFVLKIKSRHGRKSPNLEISASPCTNVIFIMYSHTPSVVLTYGPFGHYGLCINIKVSMKQRSTFYSLSLSLR